MLAYFGVVHMCFYITKYHEHKSVYAEAVVYPGIGS